jgi:stress response protein YsnF
MRYEDGMLIVPVMKEVLVVHKQLVLVEEIRVGKRQVTEDQTVREVVRRERVELEDASVDGIEGLGAVGAGGGHAAPRPPDDGAAD